MIAEVKHLSVPDDVYGNHLTHHKSAPDLARWERLKNRLADELALGMTIRRLAIELGKLGTYGEAVSEAHIVRWASDPNCFRDLNPHVNEPSSYADQLEKAIEARFMRLDEERENAPFVRPATVETSITTAIIDGIVKARNQARPVVIEGPSGIGKTAGIDEYIARTRKAEGFDCPVWRIDLHPSALKMKPVLALMLLAAQGLDPANNWNITDPEHVLAWKLAGATENRGGVFIIDEGQGLSDSDQVIPIFDELRSFTDKRLFGLVINDNGELYMRLKGGKRTQLASRIEAGRVVLSDKVEEDDVDRIMQAWNVTGAAERAYSIKLAKQPGHFRLLCEVYEQCLWEYGAIDYESLKEVRPVS
jgi:DNA transposition AAA+ family ATPase